MTAGENILSGNSFGNAPGVATSLAAIAEATAKALPYSPICPLRIS